MQKKVAIVTLYNNDNIGNKLQNYAVQNVINNCGFESTTLRIYNSTYKYEVLDKFKYYIKKIIPNTFYKNESFKNFEKSYLNNSKKAYFSNIKYKNLNSNYDYFIIGSDQVWNPNFGLRDEFKFLNSVSSIKKISFSASFGVNSINEDKSEYEKGLQTINSISVREDSGKIIIEDLTGRTDVEVLVDPTMLLTSEEWDKVSVKPDNFDKLNGKKYILNYFLGNLSDKRKNEIERIAKENDCEIINLLDKNDPFYVSGPSEFLYLEKNAFLICTDSFHSSVFALLYNRPFIIFERDDNFEKMNSRLDTLISKFKLKNRRYNGKNITKENLEHDYTEAYIILEKERMKSNNFLRKSLNIDD